MLFLRFFVSCSVYFFLRRILFSADFWSLLVSAFWSNRYDTRPDGLNITVAAEVTYIVVWVWSVRHFTLYFLQRVDKQQDFSPEFVWFQRLVYSQTTVSIIACCRRLYYNAFSRITLDIIVTGLVTLIQQIIKADQCDFRLSFLSFSFIFKIII